MTTLNVAVTRIRAWVSSATRRCTNHYTITAIESSKKYISKETFFHNNVKHLKKELSTMTTLNVAVTRIRAWVSSATTRGSNHYTITAIESSININSFQRNFFS
jgi:hypothetical protein